MYKKSTRSKSQSSDSKVLPLVATFFGVLLLGMAGIPMPDVGYVPGQEPSDITVASMQTTSCSEVSRADLDKRLGALADGEGQLKACASSNHPGVMLLVDAAADETSQLTIDFKTGLFVGPLVVKKGVYEEIRKFRAQPVARELIL